MTYKISRDGQEYGPYTLEELQQYVAEGSILATDYAFNGLEWVTVSQLLQDPQRGLATAHSVSSAAHAVSSIGGNTSQMNNPKTMIIPIAIIALILILFITIYNPKNWLVNI